VIRRIRHHDLVLPLRISEILVALRRVGGGDLLRVEQVRDVLDAEQLDRVVGRDQSG